MTPLEKAFYLIANFMDLFTWDDGGDEYDQAKEKAIDAALISIDLFVDKDGLEYGYWQDVQNELNQIKAGKYAPWTLKQAS